MKAILVIDKMPNNCSECPCCCEGYCSHLGRWLGIWAMQAGKPVDCQLKPLPQKRDVGYPNNDYEVGFGDGWDALLKEITE